MSSVACDIGLNANLSIRADSLTSNCLSHEERTAIRRSDRKAGQVLGVTLTRDVSAVDTLTTYQNLGVLMAKISAKRPRSRHASNATLVASLKDLGMKMKRLDKLLMTYGHDRKRQWHGSPQRVVLDLPVGSHTSSPTGSASSSTAGSGDGYGYDEESRDENARCLEQMPWARSHMPLAPRSISPSVATFTSPERVYDPYDTVSDFSIPDTESFPWDFVDPFSISTTDPAYAFVQAYYSKMHLGDRIAPHMHDNTGFAQNFPFAYLSPPLPLPSEWHDMGNGNGFNVSVGNPSMDTVGDMAGPAAQASTRPSSHCISTPSRESVGSTTSDESLAVSFQRANLEYVNAKLQAQEAYEHREEIAEEIARRERRAKVRSKLKQIALLGEEARQVVTAAP